jgi:hypothetical protein
MPRDPSPSDYEQLRGFVPHPSRAPEPSAPDEDRRISVMAWLVALGGVVKRRLRTVPGSPLIRIHARR